MLKRVSSGGKRCNVYVILYSMSNLRDTTFTSLTQMDLSELTVAGPVEHAQIHLCVGDLCVLCVCYAFAMYAIRVCNTYDMPAL